MRAARATVRLELPQGFMRPGSPLPSGARVEPATIQLPIARAQPAPPPSSKWLAWLQSRPALWTAGALVFLLAATLLLLWPRSGSLVVTALGPGSREVQGVTIFVDGRPLCQDMPLCRIDGLTAGSHSLRAEAPGLATPSDSTVEITAGGEATFNLDLVSTVPPEARAGALRIAAAETELTLYVDGKRVGKLPQEVSGLSAGKHWLKLEPEDGSPPIEKAVTIVAGETLDVDATPAKRDKTLVTIRLSPESEGASVTLNDAFLLDFPAELELEPGTVHHLSASKPGYEDYTLEVQVDEGETEKLIEVALTPIEGASATKRPKAKSARKPAAAKASTGDATRGVLNISSVPPSQIILNGRPLGTTPKTGITVPGDSLQTIVFVHPKMGRRRAQKFVPAGKERTVSIRF